MPYELKSARFLAAEVLRQVLSEGDLAIDATMGNGHDTETLCRLVGPSGHVYAFDIQPDAVENTRLRLADADLLPRATLFCLGHEHMAERVPSPVRLVMFNLGWLPGGDHRITTLLPTTLSAVEQALSLLLPGGVLVLCAYPGHEEGAREKDSLIRFFSTLPLSVSTSSARPFSTPDQVPRNASSSRNPLPLRFMVSETIPTKQLSKKHF